MRSPSRRQFIEGMGAVAATAGLGISRGWAQDARSLTGTQFDLTVGATSVNFTGRARVATTVNGTVPGPILRFREGETITARVRNTLAEPTSIHWHGILLPNAMDGVPGLTFRGIMPGETFIYRFPIRQSGTYWYHSHSGMQEQTGLYGALIVEPRGREPYVYQREFVVMLTDWTDEDPMTIVSNLKQQSDYYNYNQRTLGTFLKDTRRDGLSATAQDRLMWGQMRMSPTDIMDVSGATYTFLMNGQPPGANWTGLFNPEEKVRLRFINGSSMSTFDVRIPGLAMTVVQADGSDVEPFEIDEFRIGTAETYDVIVTPRGDAYTIFAQAEDRSGYARGTLAARAGLSAALPPMDPVPMRSMADMGMGGMDMKGMDMKGMAHDHMPGMKMPVAGAVPTSNADGVDVMSLKGKPSVDNVAVETRDKLGEPGAGLENNGRRVLTYRDLRSLTPRPQAPPTRALEFHLTGNMERWIWGFNGKKFSEASAIEIKLGERIRFVLVNDTMMEHPIHLHGYFFEVENGAGDRLPLKHTINVKPGERMSFVFTADAPGHWAFHCHLMYHMEMGMFRTVLVS